jgi:hypothetical protein
MGKELFTGEVERGFNWPVVKLNTAVVTERLLWRELRKIRPEVLYKAWAA